LIPRLHPCTANKFQVKKGPNFNTNPKPWNRSFDHNHLRISRIIRCLRVLGLPDEAQAFFKFLRKNATGASNKSHEFWQRAAERPLNVRPDLDVTDSNIPNVGPEFLRKFEKDRKDAEEVKKKSEENKTPEESKSPSSKIEKSTGEENKESSDEEIDARPAKKQRS
jgi:hypothetical protein